MQNDHSSATETASIKQAQSQHSAQNQQRYSSQEWLVPTSPHERWHQSRALSLIEKLPVGRFLDVGCATSPLGRHVTEMGWEAHGIELSEAGKVAEQGGVIIHPIDMSQVWELPENHFDFIFAGEVIEHVLDTLQFARNLYRVAKPGATVVITTPNITSLENRLRSLIGVHPRFMDFGFAEEQVGHCRYFTRKKLRELLGKAGFRDIHIGTGNACLSLQVRGKDLKLPRLVNRLGLGSNLFAVGHKTA